MHNSAWSGVALKWQVGGIRPNYAWKIETIQSNRPGETVRGNTRFGANLLEIQNRFQVNMGICLSLKTFHENKIQT